MLILSGVFNEKVEPGSQAVEPKQVSGIEVGEVKSESYESGNKVYGTTVSDENAQLSSEIMADVSEILVKNGDVVKREQPLIRLNREKVDAALNRAAANIDIVKAKITSIDETIKQVEAVIQKATADLTLKEKVYNRVKSLYENGATSLQELDQAETAYLAAKASLAEAESKLETTKANRTEALANLDEVEAMYNSATISVKDATITAPFDGVVVETLVDIGDLVNPGKPLVTVEKAPYFLEVFVDERKQNQITLGQQIPIKIDAIDQTLTGNVTEITPKIDPASRTFKVNIQIQDQDNVKSGMFGYAVFEEADQKAIFIPKSAIYNWSQLTAVFVVDEQGITHLRYVQLGEKKGDHIEILSGLNVGEKIVLKGIDKVKDGVQVVNPE